MPLQSGPGKQPGPLVFLAASPGQRRDDQSLPTSGAIALVARALPNVRFTRAVVLRRLREGAAAVREGVHG
jgi:hypothetical protein